MAFSVASRTTFSAVAKIRGRFFVSDGSDSRSNGDPLRHAVFVFEAR